MVPTTHTPQTTAYARPEPTAAHYGISRMTLWRWERQPGFPVPIRRGNVILHDLAAIDEWLRKGG